jgi:hypothetical protein
MGFVVRESQKDLHRDYHNVHCNLLNNSSL